MARAWFDRLETEYVEVGNDVVDVLSVPFIEGFQHNTRLIRRHITWHASGILNKMAAAASLATALFASSRAMHGRCFAYYFPLVESLGSERVSESRS